MSLAIPHSKGWPLRLPSLLQVLLVSPRRTAAPSLQEYVIFSPWQALPVSEVCTNSLTTGREHDTIKRQQEFEIKTMLFRQYDVPGHMHVGKIFGFHTVFPLFIIHFILVDPFNSYGGSQLNLNSAPILRPFSLFIILSRSK